MTDEWYYSKNRQRVGPVSLGQLQQLLGSGELQATDMVLPHGSQKWLPASSVNRVDGAGSLPSPARGKTAPDSPGSTSVNGVAATGSQWDGEGPVKQQVADVGKGAPASVPAPPQGVSLFKTLGRFLLLEIKETGLAVWRQSASLLRYVKGRWRKWTLCRNADVANLTLGQRLHGGGEGDSQLRSQIATLEAMIRTAGVEKRPTKALKMEQDRLLMQLAGATLIGQSPPAGADAEYREAKKAQAGLDKHAEEMTAARRVLLPKGGTEWRRVVIGWSALVGVVLVPLLMSQRGTKEAGEEDQARQTITEVDGAQEQPALGKSEQPALGNNERLPQQGKVEEAATDKEALIRTAEGIGTTHDEALKDAFRKAIWQVVGVVVDAETIIRNDQIASEQVLAYGNGIIRRFEELSQVRDQELFRVRIRAVVEKGKVFERLKAINVAQSPVKGDDLYVELVTRTERARNAQALVQKALRDFPLNVMSAEVLGKPEIIEQSGGRAKIRVRVSIRVNPQAYLRFMSGLTNTLEIVATEKRTDIGFYRWSSGILRDKHESTRLPSRELGSYCKSLGSQAGKDVAVLINTHRTQDNGRTEWVYFRLDEIVKHDLVRCCRNSQIKLTLLSGTGELIAVDRHPAVFDRNDGWAAPVPANAIRTGDEWFGSAFVISPFFYRPLLGINRPDNGLFFWDGRVMDTEFDLSLDEIKSLKEIKCELSQ